MTVASRLIVERFDVVRNVSGSHFSILVDLLFDALFLQAAEERLCNRVVPAISSPAHAWLETVRSAEAPPIITSVLRALVRVNESPAQCLSWMAVAAVYDRQYQLGRDNAQDAIMFARRCRDRFREGFASVYLGHALRQLGETREAANAYASALRLFPKGQSGRIHAVAMLSMAEVTEKLGMPGPAAEIFASALTLAQRMKFPDLEAAANEGLQRVKAVAGKPPVAAPGTEGS